MGKRKSKQAGGHMPLTNYERTKKFKSSEYGTTTNRVAGHSQYQAGECGLSLTSLENNCDSILCTPSGHFYEKSAILEYLLTKTQEIKEQQAAFLKQEQAAARDPAKEERLRQQQSFIDTQKTVIKSDRMIDKSIAAKQNLRRTSYWLADSQPDAVVATIEAPPERPASPHSGQPLRRKELWPLALEWEHGKLVCSVSKKPIHTQEIVAYWTSKKVKDEKDLGQLILASVYKDLGLKESKICPISSKKIRHIRTCQKSGSSFAGGDVNSANKTVAKKYRPTIT